MIMFVLFLGVIYTGFNLYLYFYSGESDFEVESKENIIFWYTDESMGNYYNNAASTYNKNHNVTIIPTLMKGSEYIEQIYEASIQGEMAPDFYAISNEELEKAYLAGLTIPIEQDAGIESRFPEIALQAVSYDGKLQGYPLYYETSVFVYNKSYLDAMEGVSVPTTVEELLALANQMDAPEGVEAIFKWDVRDVFYNYFYVGEYMNVGGISGDDVEQIDILNENTIAGLETFQKLTNFFYIDPDEVTAEGIVQDFIDGKILFTIVDTNGAKEIEDAKADGFMTYDYEFATIPNPSDTLLGSSLSVTNALVINGYSDQKAVSEDFIQFLTYEFSSDLYEKTGNLAANNSFVETSHMEQIFMQEYEDSVSMPKMMATSNYWMLLENVFFQIWEGADISTELQKLQDTLLNQIAQ